jgi:hypothetical protein
MRRLLITVSVFLLAMTLAMAPALAGKGGQGKNGERGGKNSGTLELVLLDASDDVANHYDLVTFDVTTSASDRPFVGVRCWQGTDWVYDGYVGFFDDYLFDPWLTLDSPYWSAGSNADCEARLFYFDKRGREKVLNTLNFPVMP